MSITYVSTTTSITVLGVRQILVIDAPACAASEVCTGSCFNELMPAAVVVDNSSTHVEESFLLCRSAPDANIDLVSQSRGSVPIAARYRALKCEKVYRRENAAETP